MKNDIPEVTPDEAQQPGLAYALIEEIKSSYEKFSITRCIIPLSPNGSKG